MNEIAVRLTFSISVLSLAAVQLLRIRGDPAEAALMYLCEARRLQFLSHKRVVRLGIAVYMLSLLFCLPAGAQFSSKPPASPAAQPEVPKDALGRTTPRGTVLAFLSAARKGDRELAARYLDTRLRGPAANFLAQQLYVVLDRRLPARLNQLSDLPEGSLSDPLHPDQELAGTIKGKQGNVDIVLERVDRGKSGVIWLFSSKTLDSIPDLYDEISVVSVDNVLPEFLINNRFLGIRLFQWLAVFVGIPLFYVLAALLNRLLSPLAGLLLRRFYKKPNLPNPEVLPKPVRLLLQALLIRWMLTKLNLPLIARQFWSSTAAIIAIAGFVWLMIVVNARVEEYISRRFRVRNLTGATSMLRLGRRAIDGLAIFAGVLVALYHFGVNPTAALAGLGVGGIAVALAAQKTLENVIGGVSLIFDRTVSVGDTLQIGETVGIVDDIGLRSTRIRTFARTMVSVPNGQIANMSLENLSLRDKFWFHHLLSLHYGTTSSQMDAVLDSIRNLLNQTQLVERDSVRVRFLSFGPSSLEVEVFAYVWARDWAHFLEIQEGLLLGIMKLTESAGVQIALPSQAVFLAAGSNSTDGRVQGLLKASSQDTKTQDTKTTDQAAAKSA
jgi:MscS family membrane protein